MPSEFRRATSSPRYNSALEDLANNLWSYRIITTDSGLVQQSVQQTESTELAKNQLVNDPCRIVKQQYKAARRHWPLLGKTFQNWQVMETKFPGGSMPPLDLYTLTEFRSTSPFEPTLQINDLACLRPITSDEIDNAVRGAKNGDKLAKERLHRIHQYHRTIYEPLRELMSHCSDDLYALVGHYYSVPRATFDIWITDLSSQHSPGSSFNPVKDCLVDAISLANIELILWCQQSSTLDRRSRHFKVVSEIAHKVGKRYQRLERIWYNFRLHRYCTVENARRPDKPANILSHPFLVPPKPLKRRNGAR